MIALGMLAVLLILDGACSGYRSAAGLDARIDKRSYYRRAVGVGIAGGGVVAVVSAAIAFLLADLSFAEGGRAVSGALWVYGPYAAVIAGALLLRLVRSVDLSSLLSVVVFGPLLFLRPLVAFGGVAAAYHHLPEPRVAWVGLASVCLALLVEPVLYHFRRP